MAIPSLYRCPELADYLARVLTDEPVQAAPANWAFVPSDQTVEQVE